MKRAIIGTAVLLAVTVPSFGFPSVNGLMDAPAPRDTGALVNVGWYADTINDRFVPSVNSNYVLDGTWPGGYMGVTDNFIVGDNYCIEVDGGLPQCTTLDGAQASLFPIGDALGDSGWTDGSYQHGYFAISAGAHSIELYGDGVGGLPAGLYVRFDKIPEPATIGLLAIGAVAMLRRRKVRAC